MLTKSEAGKLGSITTGKIHKENRLARIREYDQNPNRCYHCEFILSYDKRKHKFCSRSCSVTVANINSIKSKPKCLECQEPCGSTYCSHKCQQLYIMKLKVTNGTASGKTIKRYIVQTKGYACEECKISSWNNKGITLELEHKNGNSEDHSLENVCLLCPNCHSQTPTYKSKNRGNGRHFRRERYKTNLSY